MIFLQDSLSLFFIPMMEKIQVKEEGPRKPSKNNDGLIFHRQCVVSFFLHGSRRKWEKFSFLFFVREIVNRVLFVAWRKKRAK
jgi:hypothetical protein